MQTLRLTLCFVVITMVVVSCEEDGPRYADSDEMSDFAKNYLQMKLSPGMNLNSFQNSHLPSGFSSRLFTGRSAGRTNDSTATDPVTVPSPWISCAVVTETENADKSITVTYDYGDGCEEGNEHYKYFIHGKYSYTWYSNIDSLGPTRKETYSYTYESENYGGRYYNGPDTMVWSSNGVSNTGGYTEYDSKAGTYRGEWSIYSDNTYVHDGIAYVYQASSESWYDARQSVLKENESTTRNGDNYYYSLVLDPLVSRYDCSPFINDGLNPYFCYYVPVYVSGREFIKYRQDGNEGAFTIDYGNGTCDSIVTIEENGKTFRIDLGEGI